MSDTKKMLGITEGEVLISCVADSPLIEVQIITCSEFTGRTYTTTTGTLTGEAFNELRKKLGKSQVATSALFDEIQDNPRSGFGEMSSDEFAEWLRNKLTDKSEDYSNSGERIYREDIEELLSCEFKRVSSTDVDPNTNIDGGEDE